MPSYTTKVLNEKKKQEREREKKRRAMCCEMVEWN
jgi:hypothetical protein